jgi:hypothetical protein
VIPGAVVALVLVEGDTDGDDVVGLSDDAVGETALGDSGTGDDADTLGEVEGGVEDPEGDGDGLHAASASAAADTSRTGVVRRLSKVTTPRRPYGRSASSVRRGPA